ncbi:MAG: cytidine deaminase [Muribaculaceae bacterium]|nr:cytidine deaminase [Muribaculaceae bacterium]
MNEFEIKTQVKSYSYDELSATDRQLVDAARGMTAKSYAPYSHFHVGAAILLSNGEIITGANQENAAFPSGTCAERSAAFYAHSQYPDAQFEAIAIAASDANGELHNPISPCGACRQSLLEFETLAKTDVRVLLASRDRIFILKSIKSLLPLAFSEF